MSNDKLSRHLHAGVVIADQENADRTGAQALAPDHSPRAPLSPRTLPTSPLHRALGVEADLLRRVEQFLFHQAELLDGQHWHSYIDLFDEDGVYWMPVSADQTEWLDSPSIFAEDKWLMSVRAGRVTHPNAWSQAPSWGTSHVVGNVVIESQSAQELLVRSRFQMMELRRDEQRHFAGTYRHTLRETADGFRIRLQRVDLLNSQAIFDYVLQAWV